MTKRVFLALLVLTITGCANIPEPIEVAEGTQLVGYQEAAMQPEAATGKTVRWGGVVALVENRKDQTMLEIVHYPLRSYGRPVVGDQSIGRFRVYVNGFLDPVVYEQGKAVTFVGTATGVEEGLVGEHEYVFPVMDASGYYLWKDVQRVDVTSVHVWPYYGWGIGFPYHTRHRVYIHSGNSSSGNSGSGGTTSTSTSSTQRRAPTPNPPPSQRPAPRDPQTKGVIKDP